MDAIVGYPPPPVYSLPRLLVATAADMMRGAPRADPPAVPEIPPTLPWLPRVPAITSSHTFRDENPPDAKLVVGSVTESVNDDWLLPRGSGRVPVVSDQAVTGPDTRPFCPVPATPQYPSVAVAVPLDEAV